MSSSIIRITKHGKPVEPGQVKSHFATNLSALNKPKPLIEEKEPVKKTRVGAPTKSYTHSETGENLTVKQWSKILGVSQQTIQQRVARGKNPDNTDPGCSKGAPNYQYRTGLDSSSRGKKPGTVTHSETGERLTYFEWAEKLGVSYSTVHYRVSIGRNPDDTLMKVSQGETKAYIPVVPKTTPAKSVQQAGITSQERNNQSFRDRLGKHVSDIDTNQDVLNKPIKLNQLKHYKDLPAEYANASVTLDKEDQANLLHVLYDLLQETEATASKLRALLKALPDD